SPGRQHRKGFCDRGRARGDSICLRTFESHTNRAAMCGRQPGQYECGREMRLSTGRPFPESTTQEGWHDGRSAVVWAALFGVAISQGGRLIAAPHTLQPATLVPGTAAGAGVGALTNLIAMKLPVGRYSVEQLRLKFQI